MANLAPGQYTTAIVPTSTNHQQMYHLQGLGPQIHQVYAQQQQVAMQQYQQPSNQPHQSQPVVQTRIVHVSHRQTMDELPKNPVRQFVTFKNLRHLNTPGQQWEHCEHITIALTPEELERKVRNHDIPGNDLIHCLTSMGVYRQRHVRKYEDKLNQREADPANWHWVLEALGELRDKPKATPHTFWAIFQRTQRRSTSQQPQLRQVMVHHDPVQVVEAPTQPSQQTVIAVPDLSALPPAPTQLALPPAPTQLALPPPPSAAPATYTSSSQPTIYSHATGSVNGPMYEVPRAVQPTQYKATTTTQATHYQPAVSAPTTYTSQPVRQITQQPAQVATTAPIRALAAPPQTTAAATTTVRQLTQAYAQGSTPPTASQYSRPIPGVLHRHPSHSESIYRPTPEIDVHQYQVRDHSPVRYSSSRRSTREKWDYEDSLSDDSTSTYDSSSETSAANYTPCGKQRPPLGSRSKSYSSDRDHKHRSMHSTSRNQSSHSIHHNPVAHISASSAHRSSTDDRSYASVIPASSRQARRQKTYDIEVKFGSVPSSTRPAPIRRSTSDKTPRSYSRHDDIEYEYESPDEAYGKSHGHGGRLPRAPMPGSFGQSAPHVSYAPERRSTERRYH